MSIDADNVFDGVMVGLIVVTVPLWGPFWLVGRLAIGVYGRWQQRQATRIAAAKMARQGSDPRFRHREQS